MKPRIMERIFLSLLLIISILHIVAGQQRQQGQQFIHVPTKQFIQKSGPPPPQAKGLPISRPRGPPNGRAFGYQTQGVAPVVSSGAVVGGGQSSCTTGSSCSGYDYNTALAGGIIGGAGIKARINQRGFQYASTLIAPILDQQIRSARIPPISQCIPEVNGCIQVYNLYVSRYRCPARVVVYPAPPNQIVIAVQNMDIGVTGNLGGQINILIPIAITGIIQVNAHQVSVTVALAIDRSPTGSIALRMTSCQVTIGYLDAYIENGGLIGDIANSQFRRQISSKIQQMLPSQLCNQLPNIISQQLNSKLTALPQSIALTQILSVASGAFGLDQLIQGGGQCPSTCAGSSAGVSASAPKQQISAPISAPIPPAPAPSLVSPVIQSPSYREGPPINAAPRPTPTAATPPPDPPAEHVASPGTSDSKYSTDSRKVARVHASGVTRADVRPLARPSSSGQVVVSHTTTTKLRRSANRTKRAVIVSSSRPRALAPSPNHVIFASGPNPCSGCPGADSKDGGAGGILLQLAKSLDTSKLSNLQLTVQFLQGYATSNDYTIELNGEFSPNGRGGTPFGPFPMQFPYAVGGKMAEVLISDYTINSLFYWMHRSGFLTFRIGPETPKIGELLKTSCSDDEEDGGIEDHGVELDEENTNTRIVRVKRQDDDDGGGLADLGICLGDILPAIREKYPNQKVVISIHTARAPSVVLSSRNGGSATIDLNADADLFIEATNQNVGTINIAVAADITLSTAGGRISGHAEITNLKLTDPKQTLGLQQDALDNLGNLGKEVIQKAANDALEKGIALNIPSGIGGLPITIVQPEVKIVDHALWLAADFTIDPSGLGSLLGGSGGGSFGTCPRRRHRKFL